MVEDVRIKGKAVFASLLDRVSPQKRMQFLPLYSGKEVADAILLNALNRFQNKEYAPIEIVKTEKKGFGVRATQDLTSDTFIYEYVGEVIGPAPFARKMKDYAQEGIKHFYFMALDKEVFIDATKKGGKGRFLNHSCNPNCQVAKWTVGKKMRMGIFSKREISKNEELTFNYNVDRYG